MPNNITQPASQPALYDQEQYKNYDVLGKAAELSQKDAALSLEFQRAGLINVCNSLANEVDAFRDEKQSANIKTAKDFKEQLLDPTQQALEKSSLEAKLIGRIQATQEGANNVTISANDAIQAYHKAKLENKSAELLQTILSETNSMEVAFKSGPDIDQAITNAENFRHKAANALGRISTRIGDLKNDLNEAQQSQKDEEASAIAAELKAYENAENSAKQLLAKSDEVLTAFRNFQADSSDSNRIKLMRLRDSLASLNHSSTDSIAKASQELASKTTLKEIAENAQQAVALFKNKSPVAFHFYQQNILDKVEDLADKAKSKRATAEASKDQADDAKSYADKLKTAVSNLYHEHQQAIVTNQNAGTIDAAKGRLTQAQQEQQNAQREAENFKAQAEQDARTAKAAEQLHDDAKDLLTPLKPLQELYQQYSTTAQLLADRTGLSKKAIIPGFNENNYGFYKSIFKDERHEDLENLDDSNDAELREIKNDLELVHQAIDPEFANFRPDDPNVVKNQVQQACNRLQTNIDTFITNHDKAEDQPHNQYLKEVKSLSELVDNYYQNQITYEDYRATFESPVRANLQALGDEVGEFYETNIERNIQILEQAYNPAHGGEKPNDLAIQTACQNLQEDIANFNERFKGAEHQNYRDYLNDVNQMAHRLGIYHSMTAALDSQKKLNELHEQKLAQFDLLRENGDYYARKGAIEHLRMFVEDHKMCIPGLDSNDSDIEKAKKAADTFINTLDISKDIRLSLLRSVALTKEPQRDGSTRLVLEWKGLAQIYNYMPYVANLVHFFIKSYAQTLAATKIAQAQKSGQLNSDMTGPNAAKATAGAMFINDGAHLVNNVKLNPDFPFGRFNIPVLFGITKRREEILTEIGKMNKAAKANGQESPFLRKEGNLSGKKPLFLHLYKNGKYNLCRELINNVMPIEDVKLLFNDLAANDKIKLLDELSSFRSKEVLRAFNNDQTLDFYKNLNDDNQVKLLKELDDDSFDQKIKHIYDSFGNEGNNIADKVKLFSSMNSNRQRAALTRQLSDARIHELYNAVDSNSSLQQVIVRSLPTAQLINLYQTQTSKLAQADAEAVKLFNYMNSTQRFRFFCHNYFDNKPDKRATLYAAMGSFYEQGHAIRSLATAQQYQLINIIHVSSPKNAAEAFAKLHQEQRTAVINHAFGQANNPFLDPEVSKHLKGKDQAQIYRNKATTTKQKTDIFKATAELYKQKLASGDSNLAKAASAIQNFLNPNFNAQAKAYIKNTPDDEVVDTYIEYLNSANSKDQLVADTMARHIPDEIPDEVLKTRYHALRDSVNPEDNAKANILATKHPMVTKPAKEASSFELKLIDNNDSDDDKVYDFN